MFQFKSPFAELAAKLGVPLSTAKWWRAEGKIEDDADLRALARLRKKRLQGTIAQDDFAFTDERDRECVAVEKVPELYGISITTLYLWQKKGCVLLKREKPEIWNEYIEGGTPRAFTFVDFLDRHRKERLKPTEIPEDWCDFKEALKWKSLSWLAEAVKEDAIPHEWIFKKGKRGSTQAALIFEIEKVKNPYDPADYTYPGLITATDTGINKNTLSYLRKAEQLWSEKKPAINPKTGRLLKQRHYRVSEVEAVKSRLAEKPGNRKRWIEGRDFYPQYEALRLATDNKEELISTSDLRRMTPKEFGGLGEPSAFFEPPRTIECRIISERGYRSKHGGDLTVFAGDDLRTIEQKQNGWEYPRAAPEPPARSGDRHGPTILRHVKRLGRQVHAVRKNGNVLLEKASNAENLLQSLKRKPGRPRSADGKWYVETWEKWQQFKGPGRTQAQFQQDNHISDNQWEAMKKYLNRQKADATGHN